jgi:diguanylate cyclase (GGDEF)-like protein
LTGIANRRSVDEYLNEQWQAGALRKSPLALLMIDADHFKEFNDRLGHQAGDDCLRAIASALSAVVTRPGDVVARHRTRHRARHRSATQPGLASPAGIAIMCTH